MAAEPSGAGLMGIEALVGGSGTSMDLTSIVSDTLSLPGGIKVA